MHFSKITTLMAMLAIGAVAQREMGRNDGQVVDPNRQAPQVGSHAAMAGAHMRRQDPDDLRMNRHNMERRQGGIRRVTEDLDTNQNNMERRQGGIRRVTENLDTNQNNMERRPYSGPDDDRMNQDMQRRQTGGDAAAAADDDSAAGAAAAAADGL